MARGPFFGSGSSLRDGFDVVASAQCAEARSSQHAGTMSIRYIGSKGRLSSEILDLAGPPSRDGRFVDAFAGTGSVSREAAQRGWAVRANDLLPSAAALTRAQLTASDDVPFDTFGGYAAALRALSAAEPRVGFFAREYAPFGRRATERRYFTPENARRLDGMRHQLQLWTSRGMITEVERTLLLGDLIQATNAVANTAGTYGCFLREYAPNALKPVEVNPRDLLPARVPVDVHVGDAAMVPVAPSDVVYLDPPYTKRQYAAYYHILETLVAGDEPEVGGVTGLRPWRDRASAFCYKRRALDAMTSLIRRLPSARVLVSYSDDAHIELAELRGALSCLGHVEVHSLGKIRRYTPNAASRANGEEVGEVLIELLRPSLAAAAPGRFVARAMEVT